MILLASPGQGAQTPGFLQPWLEIPGVADRLAWWSAVTGLDLARYGTTADAEEIRDTAVAQPLLVAAALAACEVLYEDAVPDAVAGHSVGELAAAAIAGVLTPEVALVLVRERGRAMAEAAAVTETGMTAVLGGDTEEVLASIDKHGLTPANVNGAGQVVAAGTLERLARFADEPPAKARLRPLQVAGAFHTEHMEPAVGTLARLAPGAPVADPGRRCCRTATAPSSRPDATSSPGSSARSAPPSAGTRAWRRCATSASPRSSSCRPPGRSPASPAAS